MVSRTLGRRHSRSAPLWALRQLFQTMYFTSLCREEGRAIKFHVVYIDPSNPDPIPPKRIPADRWQYARLKPRVAFTVDNCVKLALATDPRASALAVYRRHEGSLEVWGVIDQGQQLHAFVRHESSSGPERPGLFEASITDSGHIVVRAGYETIAELRVNRLIPRSIDVLRRGPIAAALAPMRKMIRLAVAQKLREGGGGGPDIPVDDYWNELMCRLLLRISGFAHGGAVVLLPEKGSEWLRIKYQTSYLRLREAMAGYIAASTRHEMARDSIAAVLDELDDNVPSLDYLEQAVSGFEKEECGTALDGALWFAAVVSRVDGAVVFGPDLELLGFGATITAPIPEVVTLARDASGESGLRQVEAQKWGLRHRSMMGLCASVRGAVGFVVSQDGDVRAMTRVEKTVRMWDNVRLLGFDYSGSRSKAPGG